jgi:hypothetical protein
MIPNLFHFSEPDHHARISCKTACTVPASRDRIVLASASQLHRKSGGAEDE